MDVASGFETWSQCRGVLNLHSRWWPAEDDSTPVLFDLNKHFPDRIIGSITIFNIYLIWHNTFFFKIMVISRVRKEDKAQWALANEHAKITKVKNTFRLHVRAPPTGGWHHCGYVHLQFTVYFSFWQYESKTSVSSLVFCSNVTLNLCLQVKI